MEFEDRALIEARKRSMRVESQLDAQTARAKRASEKFASRVARLDRVVARWDAEELARNADVPYADADTHARPMPLSFHEANRVDRTANINRIVAFLAGAPINR